MTGGHCDARRLEAGWAAWPGRKFQNWQAARQLPQTCVPPQGGPSRPGALSALRVPIQGLALPNH
jgi:hypothetical protein